MADWLQQNLKSDPWNGCEWQMEMVMNPFSLCYYSASCVACLSILHAFHNGVEQLVMVYWGAGPCRNSRSRQTEGNQINMPRSEASSTKLSGWRASLPTMTQAQNRWLVANTIIDCKERTFLEYPSYQGTPCNDDVSVEKLHLKMGKGSRSVKVSQFLSFNLLA